MDELRVLQAAKVITERKAALAWLEQYGVQLTGRDKDQVGFTLHIYFAGSCAGAKEAMDVMTSYARFSLPEIVRAATECCRNDIDIAKNSIRGEIEKLP